MRHITPPLPDRRAFLRLAGFVTTGALLTACGGGGGGMGAGASASGGGAATSAAASPPPTGADAATGNPLDHLNLALTLAYVGAQFYGQSARGTGLPASAMTGVGVQGDAAGARRVSFADTAIADHAASLADDKFAHVFALRDALGARTAAQPAIDLSASGPFATAARGAALGGALDPYAGDAAFLAGAYLVENRVAAAYRTILGGIEDDALAALVARNLADSIYHGGLVRTLLDEQAGLGGDVGGVQVNLPGLLAAIDGSNVGDQSLAGSDGASADLIDAAGRPIAFARSERQVLDALYLSSGQPGGFLPAGANGIRTAATLQ